MTLESSDSDSDLDEVRGNELHITCNLAIGVAQCQQTTNKPQIQTVQDTLVHARRTMPPTRSGSVVMNPWSLV